MCGNQEEYAAFNRVAILICIKNTTLALQNNQKIVYALFFCIIMQFPTTFMLKMCPICDNKEAGSLASSNQKPVFQAQCCLF